MEALTYYASQSPVTRPGEMADQLSELPRDLAGLQRVARGLVLHYRADDPAGHGVPDERLVEIDSRYAETMLRRLFELDGRPLTEERPPQARLLGCCRDFTVLFLTMARQLGIPARARVGVRDLFRPRLRRRPRGRRGLGCRAGTLAAGRPRTGRRARRPDRRRPRRPAGRAPGPLPGRRVGLAGLPRRRGRRRAVPGRSRARDRGHAGLALSPPQPRPRPGRPQQGRDAPVGRLGSDRATAALRGRPAAPRPGRARPRFVTLPGRTPTRLAANLEDRRRCRDRFGPTGVATAMVGGWGGLGAVGPGRARPGSTARFDQLLRQAGRPELAQLRTGGVALVLSAVSAATAGAVLASRRPRYPVGWLLLAFGLVPQALSGAAEGYARYGLLARPGTLPGAEQVATLASATFVPGLSLVGFILLLTPTGSLPSARWRWFARVAAALPVAFLAAWLLAVPQPDPDSPLASVHNPFAIPGRLRDQVDLATLTGELLAVVDQTMQPTQTSLWLRPHGASPA